jgi:hypothetical protein
MVLLLTAHLHNLSPDHKEFWKIELRQSNIKKITNPINFSEQRKTVVAENAKRRVAWRCTVNASTLVDYARSSVDVTSAAIKHVKSNKFKEREERPNPGTILPFNICMSPIAKGATVVNLNAKRSMVNASMPDLRVKNTANVKTAWMEFLIRIPIRLI